MNMCHELVMNENILLQTLGFDLAVDHPHTHIIKCCQLVRGGWRGAGSIYLRPSIILSLLFIYSMQYPSLINSPPDKENYLSAEGIQEWREEFMICNILASKDLGQVSYLLATNM